MLFASLPASFHAAGPSSSAAVAADPSLHAVQADVFLNAEPGGPHAGPMPAVAAVGLRGGGVATGFAALDRRLPGGGWPRRALTEVRWAAEAGGATVGLSAEVNAAGATGTGGAEGAPSADGVDGVALADTGAVLRLVAPAIAAALDAGRTVMLFDPPSDCSAGVLARCGIDPAALLVVDGRDGARHGAGSLWLLERALASGEVGAVLAWLPAGLTAGHRQRLRRAARQHDGPAFVLVEADRRRAADGVGDAGDGYRAGRTVGRDADGCAARRPAPSLRLRPEIGDRPSGNRLLLHLVAGTSDDDGQDDGPAGVGVGVGVILDGRQAASVGMPAPPRQGEACAAKAAHRGGIAAGLTVLAGGLQRQGRRSSAVPRPGRPCDASHRAAPRLASSSLALDLPPLRPAASCPPAIGEAFSAAVFVDFGG